MRDGKQYLIMIKQENNCYPIKLAYWFEERISKYHTYKAGFYHSDHYYYPYNNVISCIDLDKIPQFYSWKNEVPIEGERYLVYRVGITSWYSPHYTIRKFHNGNFGSKDVKYWIKLSELLNLIEHEFYSKEGKKYEEKN